MKCPILAAAKWSVGEIVLDTMSDCLKEECAWWYKENQACAILTIAQGSVYVHKALCSIDSKTPLGGKR